MPSIAAGKTLTPRTMSMSSTRPRMPPSKRRNVRPHSHGAVARHLDQVQRVGRRAHEHGRAERLHGVKPRRRILAAPGNRERPECARALEPRPEADEESEREREEDAIAGGHTHPVEDGLP